MGVTMTLIDEYCRKKGYEEYSINYMGHSFGSLAAAWYAYRFPQIKKMLLVNLPIQAKNYDYTVAGLMASSAEKISIAYGQYDTSYTYITLLNEVLSRDNVELHVIPNEDHNFTFRMEDFLSLPEKYLL